MITYNHEKYIREAIESVLIQQVSFEYEIVIGDDVSLDSTRAILLQYKNKFPNKFKLLLWPNNIGAHANQVQTLKACEGKYVAMLEGDDYWTDQYKLQKQIDFLEKNQDFVICFHNVKITYIDEKRHPKLLNEFQNDVTTINDLARGNYIGTPSCVFKNHLLDGFPKWFFYLKVGDYPLHLLNAQFGKIKYLDEVMAVYRVHETGVWGHQTQINKFISWVEVQEILIGNFSGQVNEILAESQAEILYQLFKYFETEGDSEKAYDYLNRIMKRSPDFMYKRHVQALQYQKALLDSKSYKLGHLLLEPFRTFKKK